MIRCRYGRSIWEIAMGDRTSMRYRYGICANDMGDDSINMVVAHIDMGYLVTLDVAGEIWQALPQGSPCPDGSRAPAPSPRGRPAAAAAGTAPRRPPRTRTSSCSPLRVRGTCRTPSGPAPPTPRTKGLHSSTFRLNVSTFYGIGGAIRGCYGGV
jgi:hypothetical protein